MLKPYDEYKKTNIPWLEEVPSHWSILRNKNVLFEQKELVGDKSSDYTLLSLTLNGVIARNIDSGKGKFPKEFNSYKIVNKKNLIFCLFDVDETPRTVGLSNLFGMITGAYDVFEVKNIAENYLYYYYLSIDNVKDMKPLYTGLRKVIGVPKFLGTKLPVPPREEQDQIVKYLDFQTSKINTLIKAKKKQIELLKEQKQAVINKAVTKGLDDTVPMKDSDIEWLGEIPQHWRIVSMKNIVLSKKAGAWGEDATQENINIPCVRIADFKYDKLILNECIPTIRGYNQNQINNLRLECGDILIEKSGGGEKTPVGRCVIFNKKQSMLYANFIEAIRIKSNTNSKFIVFAMSMMYSKKIQLQYIKQTTGIQNLDVSAYTSEKIPLPSTNEQQAIVTYLEEKTALIDKAISVIEKEIELVSEYKTSLISSVVTGKLDVRNVVVPEFEVVEDLIATEIDFGNDEMEA